MTEFYDASAAGVRNDGSWSPGVPLGLFWLPPSAEVPLNGFGGAQWEMRTQLPLDVVPRMLWVTSSGAPRGHLAVEVLDGDSSLFSAPCDPEYVPQGLWSQPGADLWPLRALTRGASLVVKVHYTGPPRPARALLKPIILFSRDS